MDGRFMQVPGIFSTVEDTQALIAQTGAGADVALAVIAFNIAVLAAGDSGEFLFGQCNDLLRLDQ